MWSTFPLVPTNPAPRFTLRPGCAPILADSYSHKCVRRTESRPESLPEIPAKPSEFATKLLTFQPDPTQSEILDCPSSRVLLCCSRQWGKSTIAAIKVLHHALTCPNSHSVVASTNLRRAAFIVDRATRFALSLRLTVRTVPQYESSLRLPNGSTIVALSSNPTGNRGESGVSLVVIDEAAFVSDELYTSLRPMLATTDGAIWLLSTAWLRTGFFYQEWSDAEKKSGEYTTFTVPATACPRIPAAFLDRERAKDPATFDREYLCKFTGAQDSFFSAASIDGCTVPSERTYYPAFTPTRYYIGFDLGQKASHSAVCVLEHVRRKTNDRNAVTFEWIVRDELHVKRIERYEKDLPYTKIAQLLCDSTKLLLQGTKDAILAVDATGCGQTFMEILRKENPGCALMPINITAGSTASRSTNGVSNVPKSELMKALSIPIENQILMIPDDLPNRRELRKELDSIREKKSSSGNTRYVTDETDDMVMALSFATWAARRAHVF